MAPMRRFGTRPGLSGEEERRRARVEALAWLLDSAIRLPGGFRIGLDALIGLVPVVGDAAGALLSAYIVREAARLGAPPSLLLRMAFNVLLEGLVGAIPLLGDLFDAAWKANRRNAALLAAHLDNPAGTARSSRRFVGLVLFLLLAGMALLLILPLFFLGWIWSAVGGG